MSRIDAVCKRCRSKNADYDTKTLVTHCYNERCGYVDHSEADLKTLRAALEWMVSLGHGVSKMGGEPQPWEFEDAMENAEKALKERRE